MKNQDNLSKYFKELPKEEPSGNFTRMVMDRVRLERKILPVEYAPLISTRVWWKIIFIITLTLLAVLLLYSYFPGKESISGMAYFSKMDFSFISKPFILMSDALKNISVTHVFVLMGISLLLVIDRIYSRFAE